MADYQLLTWLFGPGDAQQIPLPIRPKLDVLPLHQLGWQRFERLCVRLGQRQPDAEHCQPYGIPGQEQQGIDLYIRKRSNGRYTTWQCKCYENLTAGDVRAVVDKFLEGDWPEKTDLFCLVTSADLSRVDLSEEEQRQAARLRQRNITFEPLDANKLSALLKVHADLVDDFFPGWVKDFCGDEMAEQLQRRRKLNPFEVTELRTKLRELYSQQFQSIDPGLPGATIGTAHGTPALTLAQRYIPMHVLERREILTAHLTTNADRQQTARNGGPEGEGGMRPTMRDSEGGHWESNEVQTRRPLFEWLLDSDRNLIIGEAGDGKSASLRFLLLDLLTDNPTQAKLAEKWGCRLPVWLPFATWTRMVASGRPKHALRDVLVEWLHNIGAAQALVDLVLRAIEDERLLLLVDGLDEWSNEVAAATTVALLNTFVHVTKAPVVATTRSSGYLRLASGLGAWRAARLAGLDASQQRELATRWFAHNFCSSLPGATSSSIVLQRVELFTAELQRDAALGRLAEVPLLLSGLVALSLAGWQLPRSRLLAYQKLTELLVETHPTFRRAASLAPHSGFTLSTEETYRALARLAFEIHASASTVVLSKDAARNIVADHLSERLKKSLAESHDRADELLKVSAETFGILVEKTNDEIGFIHRVFQEFLAACHLHRQRYSKQREKVRALASNPVWHDMLLCLCYLTTREDEVDGFLDEIEATAKGTVAALHHERLLAEIAFGDLHVSPTRAAILAQRAFDYVETGWWLPLRRRLLDLVIDGLNSAVLRESVIGKLRRWFPDPTAHRWSLYEKIAAWPFEPATVETIWRGMAEDNDWQQKLAAHALATFAKGNDDVGQRLTSSVLLPTSPEFTGVCLLALSEGWPAFPRTATLLEEALDSRHWTIRIAGIIGLLNMGRTDNKLRDLLLASAKEGEFYLWRWSEEIVKALLKAWPGDQELKWLAIQTLEETWRRRSRLSYEIAGSLLIRGFPMDNEVAELYAKRIRSDGLSHVGYGNEVEQFSQNFAGHPVVIAAIEDRLGRRNIFGRELYYATICARSPRIKAELLQRLKKPDFDSFWIVESLVDGWGANDSEVATALKLLASSPKIENDRLGDTLLKLPLTREECRRRLLSALQGGDLGRRFSVIEGLGKLGCGPHDEDVVNAALKACERLRWQDSSGSDRAALIGCFGSHPRVREFAQDELHRRNAQIGAVANTFASDPEMRDSIRQALQQVPESLRLRIVERLETIAPVDDFAIGLLSCYEHETDETTKIVASCAYHNALRLRAGDTSQALQNLSEDLVAVGHDYEERRQAALLGFASLERVQAAEAIIDHFDKKPVTIRFGDSNRSRPNLVRRLARYWPDLVSAFGDSIWERLSVDNLLGSLLGYVEDPVTFEQLLQRWESQDRREREDHNALRAVARRFPRGRRIRELCVSVLVDDRERSSWSEVAELIAAAEIVGEQFGGEIELRLLLESQLRAGRNVSPTVIALCIGWPSSEALDVPFLARERGDWLLPADVHLACRNLSPSELLASISNLLGNLAGGIWEFLPNLIPPILRRFQTDSELRILTGRQILMGASPDQKATLLKLFARTGGITSELEQWAQVELERQMKSTHLPELGFDLFAGRLRPVAHSLLDVLASEI